MGNLAGWPYWKVVSITGQAGSGTDNQVKIEIGDSAGGDFHLEGHCTNFPQDIRITDDDGTTLLDHFVEDITADPIVVHVEVKDDLGSNRDIRVYYGKSGETTASNGANTFLQYHGSASANFLDSLSVTPPDIVYEAKIRATASTHDLKWGMSNIINFPAGSESIQFETYNVTNLRYVISRDSAGVESDIEIPSLTSNTWYKLKLILTSGALHGYVDDNEIGTGTTTHLADVDIGLAMRVITGTGEQAWSFARKYNSPEPAFSSAGAEQTPAGGVAPTGVFYGPLVGPFGGPL